LARFVQISRNNFRLRLRLHFGKTIRADAKMLLWVRFNQRLHGDNWADYPWQEVGLNWRERIDAPGVVEPVTFFERVVQRAATDAGVTQAEVRKRMEIFFEVVETNLKAGKGTGLKRLGTFYVGKQKVRAVHGVQDPPIIAPAKKIPKFRFSDSFMERIS
jgi:nucleoid DNA-binding protein